MTDNNTNTSQYVPKFYVMDPVNDRLLFDGTELREGMVVLVGAEQLRFDPRDLDQRDEPEQPAVETGNPFAFLMTMRGGRDDDARIRDGLDEVNRWCTIIRLQITEQQEVDHGDHQHPAVGYVEFIGEYFDGTQRKRGYPVATPWLVRKFSIPGADAIEVPDDLDGLNGDQAA